MESKVKGPKRVNIGQEQKDPRVDHLPMAFTEAESSSAVPPTPPVASGNERYRTKSIATRFTKAEFAEVESAARSAGQEVSEWLRCAALAQARAEGEEHIDPILLAEIVGVRALILNLYAKASAGPVSREDLREISEYSDAVKQRKADEVLARKWNNDSKPSE